MSLKERASKAWNVFKYDEPVNSFKDLGQSSYYRPDKPFNAFANENSIVSSIYNRIANDVAQVSIKHVRVDGNGNYIETINSGLNQCLTLSANIDQTGRAFILDSVLSLFEEGAIAIVPVDVDLKSSESLERMNPYKILSLRTGKITRWFPQYVEIELYNDQTGKHEKIKMDKMQVAIIYNPFYEIMNDNTTFKRLRHKLGLLDIVDKKSCSGKLDMIIQLPYAVRNQMKHNHAIKRKQELVSQLENSEYGVAYIDSTEKITQLNRPVENNLQQQIESLTANLYNQLGVTKTVLDGTASSEEMLNYYSRAVEPVLSAITDEFTRKFLSKTARTQGQAIKFFSNPFKLIPIDKLSGIADSFVRNEILTANDIRSIMGIAQSSSQGANDLRNPNISPDAYEEGYGSDENGMPEDVDLQEGLSAEYDIPSESGSSLPPSSGSDMGFN